MPRLKVNRWKTGGGTARMRSATRPAHANAQHAGDHPRKRPPASAGTERGTRRRVLLHERFQVERQVAGRLKSFPGILLQAMADGTLQGQRRLFIEWRIVFQHRAHAVRVGASRERALARNHFVQDATQAENVGARIDRIAAHLFRRHVRRRAQYNAGCRDHGHGRVVGSGNCGRRELGQAEVQDLDPALISDEQVLRFDVAMRDAAAVRRRQSQSNLPPVVHRLPYRKSAVAHPRSQRLAFQ